MAPLCLLSRRRERRWPAGQTHFCRACWSLSAHIKRCPNEKGYPMRGHPLLQKAAKVGKNAPRGFPPAPRLPADFLFMKIGGNADTSAILYTKRGCGPGDYGGHKSMDLLPKSCSSRVRKRASRFTNSTVHCKWFITGRPSNERRDERRKKVVQAATSKERRAEAAEKTPLYTKAVRESTFPAITTMCRAVVSSTARPKTRRS